MSTTYYLSISGGADVLLVDSGGTILAYQAGSTEGPGGTTTYTVSPVFDTTLFDMPTDVQVWYSNDGTNFAYAPGWITGERSGDTITVEVTETTTVTAKLYYSNGTVVTDENDNPVASVSAELVAGTLPTIGTVTVAGSTTPTEGVAETYSATFDGDATDATYLWETTDVGATIATPEASSTDITFSTSGSFDVKCTVSSDTATDSTQEDTLGVTVAAGSPSYDILQVTGPGTNGDIIPGLDTAENGTLFSFSSGDFPFDTHGIVRWGLKLAFGSWYVAYDFVDSIAKTTFKSTYSGTAGFEIISSGSFGTSTVTFSGSSATDRAPTGIRYGVASPALTTLASDINAGAVVTVNNP